MCHGPESRHNSEFQWAMALHIVTFSIAASQVAERSKIAEFCIVEGWTNCEAFFVTPWAISLVAGVVSVAANANFYYQFYHKKAVSSTRRFVGNTLSIGLWLPAVIIGFLPISPEKSIGAFRWAFKLADGVGNLGVGYIFTPISEVDVYPHFGVAGAIFVIFSFSWTTIVWLFTIYRIYVPKAEVKDEENRPPPPASIVSSLTDEDIHMEPYRAPSPPSAEHVETGPPEPPRRGRLLG